MGEADRLLMSIFARAKEAMQVTLAEPTNVLLDREAFMKTKESDMTEGQMMALRAVCRGRNVAIIGPAGTGKSFIIRTIKDMCAQPRCNMRVLVTATTGVAATAIDGVTLHSAMGFGITFQSPVDIANDLIRHKPRLCAELRIINMLVIDEISMIEPAYMKKASDVLSHIRKQAAPFGGVQLVFLGDSLQLSPSAQEQDATRPWWELFECETVRLTTSVRQAGDVTFGSVLDKIRVGLFSDRLVVGCMNERRLDCVREDFSSALHLFSLNAEAADHNRTVVRRSGRPTRSFVPTLYVHERSVGGDPVVTSSMVALPDIAYSKSFDRVVARKCSKLVSSAIVEKGLDQTTLRLFYSHANALLSEHLYADALELCIGTRVMCVRNIRIADGLVNGALGTVVGWCNATSAPVTRSIEEEWGLGSEDDSRSSTPPSISPSLSHTSSSLLCRSTADQTMYYYASHDMVDGDKDVVPVVRMDGTDRVFAFVRYRARKDSSQGIVDLSYIPLTCAHALTVHKAQGLTLPAVIVHNNANMKMPGQVYVAVSRVPSLRCLALTEPWRPEHYSASASACKWESMESTVSIPDH